MNCWHCNTELIWGGDHDAGDENDTYSIVTNLSCPKFLKRLDHYHELIFDEKERAKVDSNKLLEEFEADGKT